MRDTVRLGRVGGVPIGVNWTLLAFAVLLAVGLSGSRLPHDAPGYSSAAYDLVGALTAVTLLVGVLLHEIGHAVVARRAGHRVDGITLSWMGGITRIEGDARRPGTELAIAVVGPAVSAVLGGFLWLGRELAISAGAGRLLVAAMGWLAVIQVALALFNLLPAAPLDGGRILHGAIWAVTGSRFWASKVTTWIGMALGVAVAAAGFWFAMARQDVIDGILLAVVGGWLMAAARDEERTAIVHRVLDGIPVADVMRPVAAAPGWITIRAFLEGYVAQRPGYVWLLERWDGAGYDGLLAGEELARVPMPDWSMLRPIDVAVPIAAATGAAPGDATLEVLAKTGGRKLILVIDGGHTVGAVLPRDLEAVVRSGRRPEPGSVAARESGVRP